MEWQENIIRWNVFNAPLSTISLRVDAYKSRKLKNIKNKESKPDIELKHHQETLVYNIK